eukprot:TRINITY_DN2727_c0_g1_i1.p5 TRINITY_DN2727_c0_g1~~TRINITY_DN2727_c0_g1_i1.p5  ORF type:complete len:148 (-),score=6.25 TRINITY_DN2727_c0_g1_i1:1403-1846(-)
MGTMYPNGASGEEAEYPVEAQDRRMQEQMEHGGCIHYTRAQLLKDASWSSGFLCVILCPLARSRRRAQFLSYLTNAVNYLHPSEADDPLSALPAPTKRLPTLPHPPPPRIPHSLSPRLSPNPAPSVGRKWSPVVSTRSPATRQMPAG